MHKTDLPIATNKQHARFSMNVISSTPKRRNSSAELLLSLRITSNSSADGTKNQSHVHNPAAEWFILKFEYFSLSNIQRRQIFAVPCQILVDRSVRLGPPISPSLDADIHFDFIYLAYRTL
jgi:hypothetical protein